MKELLQALYSKGIYLPPEYATIRGLRLGSSSDYKTKPTVDPAISDERRLKSTKRKSFRRGLVVGGLSGYGLGRYTMKRKLSKQLTEPDHTDQPKTMSKRDFINIISKYI